MRISLLQEREPFGEILQRTLERYWAVVLDPSVKVTWSRVGDKLACSPSHQVWYANAYLNAIFVPQIRDACFEPIRREFSHSSNVWRRPCQKAYVALATHPRSATRLATHRMMVSTPVAGAEDMLIVPGNRKIRLLDRANHDCVCLLKEGFDAGPFAAEVQHRSQLREFGVSVPAIVDSCLSNHWYREEYVCGTPLNRVSDRAVAVQTAQLALDDLGKMISATAQTCSRDEYIDQRWGILERLGVSLPIDVRQRVLQAGAKIRENLRSSPTAVVHTARSHGDFQAANILKCDDQHWIIDWENLADRSSTYDVLVFGLNGRVPAKIGRRISDWVQTGRFSGQFSQASGRALKAWGAAETADHRGRWHTANLYWLDELLWHVQENANPLLVSTSPGLTSVLAEIQHWTLHS